MELDAADRADHRPVRGLRGRVVQLQGGVRGVHHRARRRRDEEAAVVLEAPAGARERAADRSRSTATPSSARSRRSASSTSCFTAGDGNRGVQTAAFNLPNDERVVREKGSKRVMLKNVQEAKFRMVLLPIAKVALPPADQKNVVVRRLLHAHPDARADARPRPAQHHRRRPRHDGAPGAEGDLQRHRGSQGGRLRPLGAGAARRPTSRSTRRSRGRCTRRSWRRRSARSASASTRRTAAASPSS